ncbi:MAG: alanine racemase [Bryobacterales bacterium]|nr:alanine racemase [Bryobacterales bacterium]
MMTQFSTLFRGMSRRDWFRGAGLFAAASSAGAAPHHTGAIRTVDDLDTPAMIIDLDILEKNIREMQEHCNREQIPLHVHIKTHKIPEIALMQLRQGATGICCQKLGEAEVMVAGGVRSDILVPYNIVGRQKLVRLARLCKRARMTVAVDSEVVAQGISQQLQQDGGSVRVLVELDTGGRRTGVQSPQAALELAQKISRMPKLDFRGVMTFPSRLEAKPFFDETIHLFKKAGLPLHEISGGGTGAESASKQIGCNVTRSGSYVFEGLKRINTTTNRPNPVTCATRMIMTVVSTPTADRVIIDGGQKTFQRNPERPYAMIEGHPEALINGMSVEHGHVDVSGSSHKFKVGERLAVIPQHQGVTINHHDEVYAVRKGMIEAVWPVAGRGRVR